MCYISRKASVPGNQFFGEEAVPLGAQEEVLLSKAEAEACLIMLGRKPFYEVLNRKLMNR